jgi:hypothetical protein
MTEMKSEEIQKIIQEAVEKSVTKVIKTVIAKQNSKIEMVNIKELSKIIKLSVPTICGLRNSGVIPFLKVGSRFIFDLKKVVVALEDYTKKNKKNLTA